MSRRFISPSALAVGVWLKRNNQISLRDEKTKRYKDRPFDLLRIESVDSSRIVLARLDGWHDGKPVFGRRTRVDRLGVEARRFSVAAAPAPPTEQGTVSGMVEPEAESNAGTISRDQFDRGISRICASIDALTAAWVGIARQ